MDNPTGMPRESTKRPNGAGGNSAMKRRATTADAHAGRTGRQCGSGSESSSPRAELLLRMGDALAQSERGSVTRAV